MEKKEIALMNRIYQDAKVGMLAIDKILKKVKNDQLKKMFEKQFDAYDKFSNKLILAIVFFWLIWLCLEVKSVYKQEFKVFETFGFEIGFEYEVWIRSAKNPFTEHGINVNTIKLNKTKCFTSFVKECIFIFKFIIKLFNFDKDNVFTNHSKYILIMKVK